MDVLLGKARNDPTGEGKAFPESILPKAW